MMSEKLEFTKSEAKRLYELILQINTAAMKLRAKTESLAAENLDLKNRLAYAVRLLEIVYGCEGFISREHRENIYKFVALENASRKGSDEKESV